MSERDMFNAMMNAAEKKIKTRNDLLIETLAIVIGKRAQNIPLSGALEELADDLLLDWNRTLVELGM